MSNAIKLLNDIHSLTPTEFHDEVEFKDTVTVKRLVVENLTINNDEPMVYYNSEPALFGESLVPGDFSSLNAKPLRITQLWTSPLVSPSAAAQLGITDESMIHLTNAHFTEGVRTFEENGNKYLYWVVHGNYSIADAKSMYQEVKAAPESGYSATFWNGETRPVKKTTRCDLCEGITVNGNTFDILSISVGTIMRMNVADPTDMQHWELHGCECNGMEFKRNKTSNGDGSFSYSYDFNTLYTNHYLDNTMLLVSPDGQGSYIFSDVRTVLEPGREVFSMYVDNFGAKGFFRYTLPTYNPTNGKMVITAPDFNLIKDDTNVKLGKVNDIVIGLENTEKDMMIAMTSTGGWINVNESLNGYVFKYDMASEVVNNGVVTPGAFVRYSTGITGHGVIDCNGLCFSSRTPEKLFVSRFVNGLSVIDDNAPASHFPISTIPLIPYNEYLNPNDRSTPKGVDAIDSPTVLPDGRLLLPGISTATYASLVGAVNFPLFGLPIPINDTYSYIADNRVLPAQSTLKVYNPTTNKIDQVVHTGQMNTRGIVVNDKLYFAQFLTAQINVFTLPESWSYEVPANP